MPYGGRGGGGYGGDNYNSRGGGGGGGYRSGGGQPRGTGQDGRGQGGRNQDQDKKLFIGGLSYETSDDSLRAHFEKFGEVTDCIVMKEPGTGKSRGFGFVTYKHLSEIDAAQSARPHKLDSREIDSKRAMPREPGSSSNQQSVTKIFVGGMPPSTTEEQLRDVFGDYGNIETVELVKDKNTGSMRGFCFITFDDSDSVDKVVLKRNIELNGKTVEVKKAAPKDRQESGRGGRGGGSRDGGRSGGGGYNNGGGYGNDQYSSYGGGYGGGSQWGQSGGGYGDYNNQWSGQSTGGFGSGYSGDYSGGAVKSGNYSSSRGQGPYGGGYGSGGGGGYGGGAGGGYNRR